MLETEKIVWTIIEYVYLLYFLSLYTASYSLVVFVTMTKVKTMLDW